MVFFYNFWLFSSIYRNLNFILFLRKNVSLPVHCLCLNHSPFLFAISGIWKLYHHTVKPDVDDEKSRICCTLYTVTEQWYFYTYETSPPSSGNPKRWHCRYVLLTLCIRGVQCASTPFSRNAPMPRSKFL